MTESELQRPPWDGDGTDLRGVHHDGWTVEDPAPTTADGCRVWVRCTSCTRRGVRLVAAFWNGSAAPCLFCRPGPRPRGRGLSLAHQIDGVTKTTREWSELSGVPQKVIRKRLTRGWSVRDAIWRPVQPRQSQKRLSFRGRSLTVAEWSVELGISTNMIYNRIGKGWPIDRVLGQPVDRVSVAAQRQGTIAGLRFRVAELEAELPRRGMMSMGAHLPSREAGPPDHGGTRKDADAGPSPSTQGRRR